MAVDLSKWMSPHPIVAMVQSNLQTKSVLTLSRLFSKSFSMPQPKGRYEFLGFRLDVQERLLLRDGASVSITPKIFDMLLLFLENPNRLLGKDEIMRTVWPDTHIDEATLTRTISELRKTLGQTAGEANLVQTVPKRGYRFVAPVETMPDPAPEVAPALEAVSRQSDPSATSGDMQHGRTNLRNFRPRAILGMLFVGTLVLLAGV